MSGSLRQALPSHRRGLSNRINDATTLLASSPDPRDASACAAYSEALTVVQTTLQVSMQTIKEQDQRWQELMDDLTDANALANERAAYDRTALDPTDGYIALVQAAETALARLHARIAFHARQPPSGQPPAAMQQAPRSATAHLPKITLPTFDGDILKFPEFWSMFQASVGNRSDMPNVTKLTYLLPLLKGAAEHAVRGYELTDANYDLIVQRLHERFYRSNDRHVSMLHAELKRIPASSHKIAEKRKAFDACQRIFRLLEQAGENLDSSRSLTYDLLAKFPSGMIRDLDKHYKVGVYSPLSEVRNAVAKAISDDELTAGFLQDLSISRPPMGRSGQHSGRDYSEFADRRSERDFSAERRGEREFRSKNRRPWESKQHSPEMTLAQNSERRKRNEWGPPCGCYFCGGDHYNTRCSKYPNAYSRRKRLQAVGRCLKCLHKHPTDECESDITCRHCSRKSDHHSVCCFTEFPSQQSKNSDKRRRASPSSKFKNVYTRKGRQSSEHAQATFSRSAEPTGNSSVHSSQSDIAQTAAEMVNFSRTCTRNSLFQTAKVTAVNLSTGKERPVRLCLDTLSNRSYITDDAARALNLQLKGGHTLYVSVFGSDKRVEVPSGIVSFGLRTMEGEMLELEASTTKLITDSPVLPTEWPEQEEVILRSWKPCLADNPFDSNKTVDILIGADYTWDIIKGAKRSIDNSNVELIPSVFGLMLAGQLHYDRPTSDDEVSMLLISDSKCTFPHELGLVAADTKQNPTYPDVDEFWNLESIGIKDCPVERDDDVAQKAFDDTVQYHEDRYHVKWPWIPEKREVLPTNYDVAYNRFTSLTKRLIRDEPLLRSYREVIQHQLASGIVEIVPLNERRVDHPTHYLPHHPVIKKSSATTKTRIVYDASSKAQKLDVSLNECLYRGPVILPDLVHLLLRFRTCPTAVISDVEKAFLQVALQPADRDVTRFLWFADDRHPSLQPDNLAVYRFRRVPFGIISSPFLLGATIQHHLKREDSEFARNLANDIYVDNLVSGLAADQSPIAYYNDVKAIFARAGMNIKQFCSNSDELMRHIPQCDQVAHRKVKVLGVEWNSASNDDALHIIRSSKWNKMGTESKRGVLQCIASLFDPLGLFQPVTFSAKVFLQNLWIQEAGWDEPLPNNLRQTWQGLRTSLDGVFDCEIPRFLGSITPESCLVVFGDASIRGYGAAVYLRSHNSDGYRTDLIFAKSRLAPIQRERKKAKPKRATVTLPRLELLAATVAASIAGFCRQSFPTAHLPVHLFTDSECVLQWIYSTKQLDRFVQRRIDKIRALPECQFHYVGTHDNPADLLTRGSTVEELRANSLWWNGPSWLSRDPSNWPETRLPSLSTEAIWNLKPDPQASVAHTLAIITAPPIEMSPMGIPFHRFSSLQRLVRVSWLCLKLLKLKIWNRIPPDRRDRFPKLKRLFDPIRHVYDSDGHNAILSLMVRSVQEARFSGELAALRNGKKTTLIRQLNLQLDPDELIRTTSRFQHADLPQTAKVPVLLPKDHAFSRLVVLDAHTKMKHAGVSSVLSEVRQRFRIPSGRMYVQKVLKPCVICRRYKRTETFALPPMPPWPSERVQRSAPFQYVGIDYFGPLKVKLHHTQQLKMWTCIFTCLSTRAIHLEPVADQTPAEFLKALIRFVSRRGCPQQIISDNGAQFRLTKLLGDRAWKQTPTDDDLLSYSAQRGIRWKFIIELAPWQGGHYERLVGVVKSVLKTAVGRRLLTWTDLVTLLTETEAIANSRPITYVTSDADSSYRVLRPVDFLLYRPCNDLPPVTTEYPVRDLGEGGKQLAAIWKSRERHLEKLWSIWYQDYLLSLRERTSMYHRGGRVRVNRTPVVGEVVLVRDDDLPRGCWRTARITKLIPSADGQIRAAELKFANGVTLRRTVNFLLPLELTGAVPQPDPALGINRAVPQGHPITQVPGRDVSQASRSDDGESFYGFSSEDVDRAADMLDLYSDSDDDYAARQ